jgi:DNA helicase-2/ATP-dependent DNA helicase PcrA
VQLTEEQRKVVHHKNGHALVSAAAGSGKTTAMVARVCHLLESGVAADKIMVLMFNRSARQAFIKKLSLATTAQPKPRILTFHALGLRLTESFMKRGVLAKYTLHTKEYQLEKISRQALQECTAARDDDLFVGSEDQAEFLNFIGFVKSDIRSVKKMFSGSGLAVELDIFIDAFALFEKIRRQMGIRFYSDLIHEPVLAMLADKTLADWVGNRVDHIIVDEYQDINEVQQQLLRFMAGARAAVMVVGDGDQCIYEWRGAKSEYIVKRFREDFRGAVPYRLSFSFRFGHRLSLAAGHLIANNNFRDRKICFSSHTNPDTRLFRRPENSLPHPIIHIIDQWLKSGGRADQIAVLVRLYAATIPVELALIERDIPYLMEGHETVFLCPEIKGLLGYLSLCRDNLAGVALRKGGVDIIIAMLTNPHLYIKQSDLNLLGDEIVSEPERAADLIREYSKKTPLSYVSSRMMRLASVWEDLAKIPATANAALTLEKIIADTRLFDFYNRSSIRQGVAGNKVNTCLAFVSFAGRRKANIEELLLTVEEMERGSSEIVNERIVISSIHRAKGLEWPVVVLPGLEDGMVPYRDEEEQGGGKGIEDERRLFFVGMTRAVEQLWLLHPEDKRLEQRVKLGDSRCPLSTEGGRFSASCFLYEANLACSDMVGEKLAESANKQSEPLPVYVDIGFASRYIESIGSELVLKKAKNSVAGSGAGVEKRKQKQNQKGLQFMSLGQLKKGVSVLHASLGRGQVISTCKRQGVVTVDFSGAGMQNLVITLARLKPG